MVVKHHITDVTDDDGASSRANATPTISRSTKYPRKSYSRQGQHIPTESRESKSYAEKEMSRTHHQKLDNRTFNVSVRQVDISPMPKRSSKKLEVVQMPRDELKDSLDEKIHKVAISTRV